LCLLLARHQLSASRLFPNLASSVAKLRPSIRCVSYRPYQLSYSYTSKSFVSFHNSAFEVQDVERLHNKRAIRRRCDCEWSNLSLGLCSRRHWRYITQAGLMHRRDRAGDLICESRVGIVLVVAIERGYASVCVTMALPGTRRKNTTTTPLMPVF
jgi:hypothetical protein